MWVRVPFFIMKARQAAAQTGKLAWPDARSNRLSCVGLLVMNLCPKMLYVMRKTGIWTENDKLWTRWTLDGKIW